MAQPQHETILFSIPLIRADEFRKAAIGGDPAEFERAYGPLEVTRVTSWLQRSPDYLIVRWEGQDLGEAVKHTAVSDDPHFAKWRGITRVYAGPDQAQAFWEAARHRIFSWSTGEQGRDTEARVFHGTASVGEYLRLVEDIREDPDLRAEFDRTRRGQGFTHAELWHQTSEGEDLVISLWEAHDLAAGIRQVEADPSPLDERILAIRRHALNEGALSQIRPEVLMDWRAEPER